MISAAVAGEGGGERSLVNVRFQRVTVNIPVNTLQRVAVVSQPRTADFRSASTFSFPCTCAGGGGDGGRCQSSVPHWRSISRLSCPGALEMERGGLGRVTLLCVLVQRDACCCCSPLITHEPFVCTPPQHPTPPPPLPHSHSSSSMLRLRTEVG